MIEIIQDFKSPHYGNRILPHTTLTQYYCIIITIQLLLLLCRCVIIILYYDSRMNILKCHIAAVPNNCNKKEKRKITADRKNDEENRACDDFLYDVFLTTCTSFYYVSTSVDVFIFACSYDTHTRSNLVPIVHKLLTMFVGYN